MPNPFDVSQIHETSIIANIDSGPIQILREGRKVYQLLSGRLIEYKLVDTPHDFQNITRNITRGRNFLTADGLDVENFCITPDGTKLYVLLKNAGRNIHSFTFGTPYNSSTLSHDGVFSDTNPTDRSPYKGLDVVVSTFGTETTTFLFTTFGGIMHILHRGGESIVNGFDFPNVEDITVVHEPSEVFDGRVYVVSFQRSLRDPNMVVQKFALPSAIGSAPRSAVLSRGYIPDSFLNHGTVSQDGLHFFAFQNLSSEPSIIFLRRFDVQTSVTKTFSIGAILSRSPQKLFSINGILMKTQQKLYSVDSLLQNTRTKLVSVNALLAARFQKSYAANALLKISGFSKTYTISGILKKTQAKTSFVNAVLTAKFQKTSLVNALLSAKFQKSYAANALLKISGFTKSYTISGILKKVQQKSFLADGHLLLAIQKLYSVNAILIAKRQKEFTANALISFQTKFYSCNAILGEKLQKEFVVNAILKKVQAKTHTANALLKISGFTKTYTISGILKKTQIKTSLIDAVLQITKTKTSLVNALLSAKFQKSYAANALLKISGFTKTYTISGILKKTQAKTSLVNALLSARFQKTSFVNALLAAKFQKTSLVNAQLTTKNLKNFSLNAILVKAMKKTHTANAILIHGEIIASKSVNVSLCVNDKVNTELEV